MLTAALITFREGLEAALIIGIILAVLRRVDRPEWRPAVWWGVASASALSLIAGLALQAVGARMEGRAEEIFEGTAMFLAAGFLTWMIFWMQSRGRQIRARLEADAERALDRGQKASLFGLAFLAVGREGFETVLFLSAVAFADSGVATVIGGVAGLAAAVVIGRLLFAASIRLDVGRFFQVTGLLLLVVAAGLVAHGVHEFQEAGVLPVVVEQVWDINPFLDEGSGVGSFLKSLFGYNGNPSLVELMSYIFFVIVVGGATWWQRKGLAMSPGRDR
jgi:high-affinity iron transporter